ncbi:hypothetical protein D3C76_819650 [compost metagenome]
MRLFYKGGRRIRKKSYAKPTLLKRVHSVRLLPFLQYQDKRGAIHRLFDAVQRVPTVLSYKIEIHLYQEALAVGLLKFSGVLRDALSEAFFQSWSSTSPLIVLVVAVGRIGSLAPPCNLEHQAKSVAPRSPRPRQSPSGLGCLRYGSPHG